MINVLRYCLTIVFILIGLNILSCTVPLYNPLNTTKIIKSDNDNRKYKFIELPNKLRVLLVSDVNADRAAASLDVNIGSRQDPLEYQGLAHFLEHMLFLGTEKYPKANEYQRFIGKHNGNPNAYTSFEHTNYFFDIDPVYLNEALDRFAQFFISPLFLENYVKREIKAVHSEFMSKIKTDQRKTLDVFKSVIHPEHPFSKFSVGNFETLLKPGQEEGDLRKKLIEFYTEYYSANLMTLVVLGNEPLETLESMVSSKFSAIANTDKVIGDIATPIFSPDSLPMRLNIHPEKELQVLSLTFPTEEEIPFFQQKPMHHIGNIIGHEGKGSLFSFLKSQGLAESLSAGSGLSYKGGGNFVITIELTEKGLEKTDQIIAAVFQSINRIKTSKSTKDLFDEQKVLARQQFRYLEQSSSSGYVRSLASNMHYYPASHVLSGAYLIGDFDNQLVDRFLAYLSPDNVMVTLNTKGIAVDSTSHFYNTQYKSALVSAQTLDRWKNIGLNPLITLPEPNEFLAKNLQIKPAAKDVSTSVKKQIPKLISEKNGLHLWYKKDDYFNMPKGSIFFSVRSPIANDSAQHSVLLEMFTHLVNDQLNELSYPAVLAGLGYSIHRHHRGFSVKISGFNDKQPLLLDKIIYALTSPVYDLQRFNNIKNDLVRQLENTNKLQPYKLLMRQLPELLYQNKWTNDELLLAYQSITIEKLQSFVDQMLSDVDIDMLVYGNYLEKEAVVLGNKVRYNLLKKSTSVVSVNIAKLEKEELAFQVDNHHSDSSILFYLQASDVNKSSRAAMGVTSRWLQSSFYTQLRTEKQLGYVVMAGTYPLVEIPGMIFMVQSPVVGPLVLQQEIQQFIKQKSQEIESLPEAEFEQHKQAMVQSLSESPKNIWKQSGVYWQDITKSYTQFDSRKQLINALKSLTFKQWRQFFQQQIAGQQRQGLWLFSTGQYSDQALVDTPRIDDVTEFKTNGVYYQFP